MKFSAVFHVAILLAWVAICGEVSASSVIPPKDYGQMMALSDAVVFGEVRELEVILVNGLPRTKARFMVRQSFKGAVASGEIISLEFLGGKETGIGVSVPGSLELESGRSYLLSLRRFEQGWNPWLLSYGQLRLERLPTGQEVFVHVEAAHALETVWPDGSKGEEVTGYLKGDLISHVREVVDGSRAWSRSRAGEWTNPGQHKLSEVYPSGCSALTAYYSGVTRRLRWSTFENDKPVRIFLSEGASPAQAQEIGVSLANWKAIPQTDLSSLVVEGMAPVPDCENFGSWQTLSENADKLLAVFDDPCHVIDDTASCVGILGLAVQHIDHDSIHLHREEEWMGLKSGMLIINNGIRSCLSPERLQQVVQHEMGHLLGFGHHTIEAATMNATCCNSITDKDIACAQFTYGTSPMNPVPQIATLTPVELAQGETREIEVAGAGFMQQTSVAVGGTKVAVESVRFVDEHLMRVRLAVAPDAQPSVRAFRLTNPKPGGGQGQDAGFVIVPRVGTSSGSESETVMTYALEPNYPNPFNPSTFIPFELPESGWVKLSVLDLSGREVRLLVSGEQGAGRHVVPFDASGLASGLYLVRLETRLGQLTRSVLFLK